MWRAVDGEGTEELEFTQEPSGAGVRVRSTVTGEDTALGTAWDASYALTCDAHWAVRHLVVDERRTGAHLELRADGEGGWTDGDGTALPHLDGCVDVDFRATPFTNTLPIRRLGLATGESAIIEVVYVDAPDLTTTRERQIYTRLTGNVWHFEQPSAEFTATITVDEDGLVVDYPGLFLRQS
jgi:hypothetical protein